MQCKASLCISIGIAVIVTSLVMEFATIKAQGSSQEKVWQIVEPTSLVIPEPLSIPITIHTPIGAERNRWIAVGKYVEYIGNEKWKWTITDAKDSGINPRSLGDEKEPSFAVTLNFEPHRPEPVSTISTRQVRDLASMTPEEFHKVSWWLPWLYLIPKSLRSLKDHATEGIITPFGEIECYRVTCRQGRQSPDFPNVGFLSEHAETASLWYEVGTGVLVKENLRTDEGEALTSIISRTNIEGLIPKQPYGVKELIEELEILSPKKREEVAEILTWIKDRRAVGPLIALLKDENEDIGVRESAAKALGEIKDDRAIEPLTAALKFDDVDSRWRAAHRFREELAAIENDPFRTISTNGILSQTAILENREVLDSKDPKKPIIITLHPDYIIYTKHIFCSKVHVEDNIDGSSNWFSAETASYTMDTARDKYDNYRYIYAFRDEAELMMGTNNITVPDPHDISKVAFDFSDPDKNYVVDKERSIRQAAAWALAEMQHSNSAKEALINALKEQDLQAVAGAYRFFLETSIPDAEQSLIKVLEKYGNKAMAEDFLSSGNSELQTAAQTWLEQNK